MAKAKKEKAMRGVKKPKGGSKIVSPVSGGGIVARSGRGVKTASAD